MKYNLVFIGLVVCLLFALSVFRLLKERTVWRSLQLAGAVCLAIVVFTHVAEEFHLFPGMGWGLPDTSGHYVDLAGAMLGLTLLPLGFCADVILRNRSTKSKTN